VSACALEEGASCMCTNKREKSESKEDDDDDEEEEEEEQQSCVFMSVERGRGREGVKEDDF